MEIAWEEGLDESATYAYDATFTFTTDSYFVQGDQEGTVEVITDSYSFEGSESRTVEVLDRVIRFAYLPGDINASGDLSALPDALALLVWGFADGPSICQSAADIDGNGTVSVVPDALCLLRWGFAGSECAALPGKCTVTDATDCIEECD